MECRETPTPGMVLFAGATIGLGILGLVSADFATNWQRVTLGVPHRMLLAYVAGVCEVLAGGALLWRRTARWGALALGGIYSVFLLIWLVHALGAPQVWDSWGNVAEELSAAIAGYAAYAFLAPAGSAWRKRAVTIARLYGVCCIPFGLTHLIHLTGAGHFAPQWIPPGGKFWAGATGVFFLMGAASLLSGVLMGLASRLLGIMVLAFELLIWLPWLVFGPPPWLGRLVAEGTLTHFLWSGNGVAMLFGAAAWVVGDVINGAAKTRAAEGAPVEVASHVV